MFFAKEMNYLTQRLAVLSKTNALVDMLYNIPLRVLGTNEGKTLTNDEDGFYYLEDEGKYDSDK